jgi:membrane protein YdbS with pleckstrin-like domain
MAYPDNLLVQGERVIVNKRPHWKVLILPTVFFILIIGAGAALAAWLNSGNWEYKSTALWVIVVVAVIALIVLVLVPFIRWRTEHFVITNHHVFFRSGLLSRREHQIPLGQIANMETEVTFWGRLMGYGSLIVESSADQPLKFRNVASLSKVQAQLNQLIRDEREATHHRRDEPSGYQQPPQGLAPQQYQQAPTQSYPPQGYPAQGGYPQQQNYPPPADPQAYPQPGYQPTQAYQQPPGYPPAGTQAAYPQQAAPSNTSTPPAAPPAPPGGSGQSEGRPASQS